MLDFTKEIFDDADIDDDNVRVGVMTYRHNATVEFHLDEYHNKAKMFDAIDKVHAGPILITYTTDYFMHKPH